MTDKRPPLIHGEEITDDDLEELRNAIETFDVVMTVSPAVHALIAERWPHLLAKVKPLTNN